MADNRGSEVKVKAEEAKVEVQNLEEFKEKEGFGGDKDDEPFVPSEGLTTAEAERLLREHGRNELPDKTTPKWLIYLYQLKGPMPIMIWIAIIVEAAIQNWLDMGILLAIQFINATIGWYESTKAADAVAALKASLKPKATTKRNGKWETIDAGGLVPGDLVLLGSGSAVPADCLVNGGQIEVDQSGLTGESLPVTIRAAEPTMMGSTVTRGEVEATVQYTGIKTFLGKTASLLQSVDELGNLQKILLKIMFVLVSISLTLCFIALMFLVFSRDVPFKKALSFVVVLLVASIPIAIEIVTTVTLAIGSRQLSAHDAIVTRLVAIEEMAGMSMLCSDKTGTLTLNKMVIQDDCLTFQEGINMQGVVQLAALAAKWKEPARDALDTMILGKANLPALDIYEQLDYVPFDPTVKRTEGTVKGPDGKVFKVTKGAPHIILNLCHNKAEIEHQVEEYVTGLGLRGIRCLSVARTNDNEEWELLGIVTFLDPPRPDTKRTIERAKEYGVSVKMITGDQVVIAVETARTLGLGTNIRGATGLPSMTKDGGVPKDLRKYSKLILEADGFAQVYPEHKFLIVEALRQEGFQTGMTGDGVNDAPALKRADVGIAVSGATDAARAAADIVLTSPGLSVVVEAIVIARSIFQRVKSFINYRVAATLQLLCFFFVSVFAFNPQDYQPDGQEWPSFFSLPVIMLMLITLLNDGTLISIGYDHVISSQRPEKWNLKVLFVVSCVLAGVALVSSLLLVWAALDSASNDGIFHAFGLPHAEYGQIVCMVYLKVSLSDFLTLFSARTQGPFWSMKPGRLLFGGACFALTISTILACVWPKTTIDDVPVEGLARGGYHLWAIWVWIYCVIWWFVQDAAKVFTYWFMYKFNIFNARASRSVSKMEDHDESEHHAVKPAEEKNEEVTVSYNLRTGKRLAGELKSELQSSHLGKETKAVLKETADGEIIVSISYGREAGKKLADELKKELAKNS